MRFLLDHHFSHRHAEMLRLYDFPCYSLAEVFPGKIKDEEWLPELKDTDWVLVTCDRHIQTRKAEARALRESGVSAVFIGPFFTKMKLVKKGEWLLRYWEKIVAWAEQAPPRSYCQIQQNGAIKNINI